jgi:2-methylcitrate dehydratase PrpD
MNSYSSDIGKFVNLLKYDSIPKEVINKAKVLLLDTIGVSIASSSRDFFPPIMQTVKEMGTKGESSVITVKEKYPMANAALVNGALIHGIDYDDTHTDALVHPSSCIIPAAMSVAEAQNMNGKDFLVSVISGYEIMIRIGLAASGKFHDIGYHATPICGTFGSAITAGKLLGLGVDKIEYALGICGSQATGIQEFLKDGTWVKRIHPGWAAHSGIISALLAKNGFTGPYKVFEGTFGIFNCFFSNRAEYELDKLTIGLGEEWETLNISLKPYPCCHFIHSFLDCGVFLKDKYDIHIEEIEKITCYISKRGSTIVCDPKESKEKPTTTYGAQFSLPFSLSMVLINGRITLQDYNEGILLNDDILELAKKVECKINNNEDNTQKYFPGHVIIKTKNRGSFEHKIIKQRGCPENPMTDEEIKDKFMNNVINEIKEENISKIIEIVQYIEKLKDIASLTELFVK